MRQAFSLVEILLAALILGVSGVLVMELVRGSTVHLEVTEVEAAARGLAADLLERYAKPSIHDVPALQKASKDGMGMPVDWKLYVLSDAALKHHLPVPQVAKLLDQYQCRVNLDIKPNEHPSFGPEPRMRQVVITVFWQDPLTSDMKQATYASIVD